MKTNSGEFCVANNLNVSVLCEQESGEAHYALIKINLLWKNTFCICVLDGGYAFECLGENEESARHLFEKMLLNKPSTEHIFDIVTDMRRVEMYLGQK